MPYDVQIKGIDDLLALSTELERAESQFLSRLSDGLAASITKASPKGHIEWKGEVRGKNEAAVYSSHPGAKALDRGAFIQPKGHPRLRFSSQGREIFPKFIRLPARHYVRKGLRSRSSIATKLWNELIGDINHG